MNKGDFHARQWQLATYPLHQRILVELTEHLLLFYKHILNIYSTIRYKCMVYGTKPLFKKQYLFGVGCTPSISRQLQECRTFWSTFCYPHSTNQQLDNAKYVFLNEKSTVFNVKMYKIITISVRLMSCFSRPTGERALLWGRPCEFESPHRRTTLVSGRLYGYPLTFPCLSSRFKFGEVVSFAGWGVFLLPSIDHRQSSQLQSCSNHSHLFRSSNSPETSERA